VDERRTCCGGIDHARRETRSRPSSRRVRCGISPPAWTSIGNSMCVRSASDHDRRPAQPDGVAAACDISGRS
jgi:hypothetical protein